MPLPLLAPVRPITCLVCGTRHPLAVLLTGRAVWHAALLYCPTCGEELRLLTDHAGVARLWG